MTAALGVAVAIAVWALARTSPVFEDAEFSAVAIALFVAAYAGLGPHVWGGPASGSGRLMVAAGLLGALGTLMGSSHQVVHTLGALAVGALVALLVFVFLCFPDERLLRTIERQFVATFWLASAVAWVLVIVVARKLPSVGPLYACERACPGNAFRLVRSSAHVGAVLDRTVNVVTAAGLVAMCVLLARKSWKTDALRRRSLVPLTACAFLWVVSRDFFTLFHHPETGGETILRTTVAASAVGVPLAMGAGRYFFRLSAADRIAQFVAGIREAPVTHASVEESMRTAVGDPRLRLLLWHPQWEAYVDRDSRPASIREGPGERAVVVRTTTGGESAVVVFDAFLEDRTGLATSLANAALLIMENQRLAAEVDASRARIATAAMAERQRLERDLHDGAQQQLLRIPFEVAQLRRQATPDMQPGLDRLMHDVEEALDDLRTIAHSIYPSVLAEAGLVHAVESIALKAPVAVRIQTSGIERLPAHVEYAVYFTVLEAIQNVTKHAGAQATATVALVREGQALRVAIADDGCGFEPATAEGSRGLTNMRDRIGAVGGMLTVRSTPGAGTTVLASVPNVFPPESEASATPTRE